MVQRDEGLLPQIRTLKAEHPFWGHRRVWAYPRFVEQLPVYKKRVLRLIRQFPHGAREQGLSLMSANGCQPTSHAFMEGCSTLGRYQAFTSDNNPQGNADTERWMRALKEECLCLQDGTCPLQLMNALAHWITYYNEHYLYSALGHMPPRQFERDYHNSHGSPFVAT